MDALNTTVGDRTSMRDRARQPAQCCELFDFQPHLVAFTARSGSKRWTWIVAAKSGSN